jgi:DNA polymerase III sliding clamp (beta) subunit (PCNA family)
MKLPKGKIELAAASPYESRYTLKAVKLDVENKRMLATDGHILAIVPTEVADTDHSGLIAVDSFKQIRAMQKRAKTIPVNIAVNGKAVATGKGETAEYELVSGQFPNADAAIPKGATYEGAPTIGLNVDLLMRLAKALGADEAHQGTIIKLWIKDGSSAVLVKTDENPEAVGVIMPVRV